MSFTEIQEQEKRRSAASAPEPTPAASGPPPSWAAAPKVTPKTSDYTEAPRKLAAPSKPPKAIPVTRAAPKPVVKAVPVTKPGRAQPVKPPVDVNSFPALQMHTL